MTLPERSTLEWALDYAAHGMHVFPVFTILETNGLRRCSCGSPKCPSPGKHPVGRLVPKGFHDATTDQEKIKPWFSGAESFNIGIASGQISGFVVLDIDPRHGGDKELAALEAQHGALPNTLRWKTGGSGEHIFFQYPTEGLRNSASRLAEGIDIRGDGGYVVAPPSRHVSGGQYSIPEGQSLDNFIAPLPLWILEALKRPAKKNDANLPPLPGLELIEEGGRNDSVARVAGHLFGKGIDLPLANNLMRGWNKAYCAPPLSDEEVDSVVANIHRCEARKLEHLPIIPPIRCASDLPAQVPPREWLVADWLPCGKVTALIGPGGVGKSLLVQQLGMALAFNHAIECQDKRAGVARKISWAGLQTRAAKTIAYFCEDEEQEIARRQASIIVRWGIDQACLSAFHFQCRVGGDNLLLKSLDSGIPLDGFYDQIIQDTRRLEANLIILDNLAQMFGGNENDRAEVTQFINRLGRLAHETAAAVLLLGHPSKGEGSEYSGSTAWDACVRSRIFFGNKKSDDQKDSNIRTLKRSKSNYSHTGDEVQLQWQAGVFEAVGGDLFSAGAQSATEKGTEMAKDAFLRLLDKMIGEGQHLSHSRNASNYAPKVMASRSDSGGGSKADFEHAMQALLQGGEIKANGKPFSGAKTTGLVRVSKESQDDQL